MAGAAEYRNESFIQDYENIKLLDLLNNDELRVVKKKRTDFENSIRLANDPKPFVEYIRFEMALMAKFKEKNYHKERSGQALDRKMALHIRNLFQLAVRKFPSKRKLYEQFITFAKIKFASQVTDIYRGMLRFHHTKEDYLEAANHQIERKSFKPAIDILIEGIGKYQDKMLIAKQIECLLQLSVIDEEKGKLHHTAAMNLFNKFLKNEENIKFYKEFLFSLQSVPSSAAFQNVIIASITPKFNNNPEFWNILAQRHLDGFFYDPEMEENETVPDRKTDEKIPSAERLQRALSFYKKGINKITDASNLEQMYMFYLDKLTELDETMNESCQKTVRLAYADGLKRGYDEDVLPAKYFVQLLQLRLVHAEKFQGEIDKMIEKGLNRCQNNLKFFEVVIRYDQEMENYERIENIFKVAVKENPADIVKLYHFLTMIYLTSKQDDKALLLLQEAVYGKNSMLSTELQPYYIEYLTLSKNIEIARKEFQKLRDGNKCKPSLSLFRKMLKMELLQNAPNSDAAIIKRCFESAIQFYGSSDINVSDSSW